MKDRELTERTQRPGVARHAKGHPKQGDRASSRRHPGGTHSGPQVIARIPRVTRGEEVEIESPRCDPADRGRPFRPWLSARLLVGGVAILVVVALGPYLTPRILGSKTKAPSTTASQETADRTESCVTSAPTGRRWNPSTSESSPPKTAAAPPAVAPSTEYRPGSTIATTWGGGDRPGSPALPPPPPPTGPSAVAVGSGLTADVPGTAGTPTDQAILSPAPTWNSHPPLGPPPLQASRPWETARGDNRVEPPADSIPRDVTTPPTEPVPAYRPPSRGGLVNRDGPPAYRDPIGVRPSGGYQTAARPSYGTGGSQPARSDWPAGYPDTGAPPAGPPPAWNRNPSAQNPAPPTGYGYQNDRSPTGYPPPVYPNTDGLPSRSTVPPAGLNPYAPSVDPGAARLDGVIEKPTARMY
jgi:hypothetical protein